MKKPYKYFIAGVLTVLLPIGVFILAIYALSFTLFNDRNTKDEIYVFSTIESPDKKFIVTIFSYSGGGAAGWSGRKVNIRKSAEIFDDKEYIFSTSSGTDIQTQWENNSILHIDYSANGQILSLYQSEWNKDKTIRILYNQK